MKLNLRQRFRKSGPELILAIGTLLFSWWLMAHTFDYRDGNFYIATKVWSDFAANLPLIRSFSWGKNLPIEYPLFPGEPIRYHFLFYWLVGNLEKIGLPIDLALNIPSALGFWGLLLIIYYLTKLLFNRRSVAFLAVVLFLFNGSFSFLEFFRQHPLSLETPRTILTNSSFPSFGPYDRKIVSAFWNLNIYTNQRHLAAAFGLILGVIYLIIKSQRAKKNLPPRRIIAIGVVIGLLPSFHKAALIILGVILASLFLYLPKRRRSLFVIAVISAGLALPQLLPQLQSGISSLQFWPGYLVPRPVTAARFASYWFLNLGLASLLIPIGFWRADRLAKKVFLAVLPLFALGNLVRFSPEIAANHKFFNLFLIVGNMFTAWAVFLCWKRHTLGKLLAIVLVFFLTLSGVIDFFPIKNDTASSLADAPNDPDIAWIKENTPPDAVFLNTSYLYHPASLAGRKIFLGWPYFSWSLGYDTRERDQTMREFFSGRDLDQTCRFLKQNRLDYLAVGNPRSEPDFEINHPFFRENFKSVYESQRRHLTIFRVGDTCTEMPPE